MKFTHILAKILQTSDAVVNLLNLIEKKQCLSWLELHFYDGIFKKNYTFMRE